MTRMFAVRIDHQAGVPALRIRRLGVWLAGCGLALAGYELVQRGVPWHIATAAIATAGLLLRLLRGAVSARSMRGVLSIDHRGRFFWQGDCGSVSTVDRGNAVGARDLAGFVADTAGIEVELRRWQFAPRFAWLELKAVASSERIGLVLARAAFTAEQWAGIGRWVTWVGRAASTRRA